MNRTEAVSLAVKEVKRTNTTVYVLRRGDKYITWGSDRKGWKVAEMIGPGNVQNFGITYQQILDRDVPKMVQESKNLARQGIMGATLIYYRHEEIMGANELVLPALDSDWKLSGVSIPANIPWDQWNAYLRSRLGNVPIFA